jgi:ketosteroid isomerase-like protein
MNDRSDKEVALDPQDLERLLVFRQNSGDVEGMTALYEPDALLVDDDGRSVMGRGTIRDFFAELIKSGKKFELGMQRPALVTGNLALTTTLSPNGSITAEVARKQPDGTWLWVIDQFSFAK